MLGCEESLRAFPADGLFTDSPETKVVLETTIQKLEKAGAKLKPSWPGGFKIEELYENYNFHLDAFMFSVERAGQQDGERKEAAASGKILPGLAYRAQWQSCFHEIDVFLSPVAFTTAFRHDHSEPNHKRTIATVHGPRAYDDMDRWKQIMGPYWEDATPIVFAKFWHGNCTDL